MTIRNKCSIPAANMLICSNEDISDIRVEGRNKEEVYKKMSVIDLGEVPMSKSNMETRAENRKKVIMEAKFLRKCLPSFLGCMLQVCGQYITSEEFKMYEDVTKHERLGNILKNVQKLHSKLNDFCDREGVDKPKSLENNVCHSCLLSKSVLANKYKSPDQIADLLLKNGMQFVFTQHNGKEGIAFDVNLMKEFSWYRDTFESVVDDVKVFEKMRTRQLNTGRHEKWAHFLSLGHLKPGSINELKNHAAILEANLDHDVPEEILVTPLNRITNDRSVITQVYVEEFRVLDQERRNRCLSFDIFITVQSADKMLDSEKYKCKFCKFIAKSKGGLANHSRSCKKK